MLRHNLLLWILRLYMMFWFRERGMRTKTGYTLIPAHDRLYLSQHQTCVKYLFDTTYLIIINTYLISQILIKIFVIVWLFFQ